MGGANRGHSAQAATISDQILSEHVLSWCPIPRPPDRDSQVLGNHDVADYFVLRHSARPALVVAAPTWSKDPTRDVAPADRHVAATDTRRPDLKQDFVLA